MNAIIFDLLKNNFSVEMSYDNEKSLIEYRLTGFYKSSGVVLTESGEKLIAIARYDETTEINDIRDLVALNYEWWISSRDRSESWKNPEQAWIPLLEKYGFIKKKTETITTYI